VDHLVLFRLSAANNAFRQLQAPAQGNQQWGSYAPGVPQQGYSQQGYL